MRTTVFLCAGAMLLFTAADARAQWWEWPQVFDGRLTVSVNGGGQAGSSDINRQSSFPLYEEEGFFESSQEASTGAIFDIGGTYRIGPNWGVGIAHTRSDGSGDALLAASLPHPGFFNVPPRQVGAVAPGLNTRENAVHLLAVLFVPFIEKVDFTFGIGPSFYSVQQGFAAGFSFSEVPPAYTTVTIDSIDVVQLKRNGVGINLSGDATYSITERIGAGLLLRYTRASVDFPIPDGTSIEISPGGFQAAIGARFRF